MAKAISAIAVLALLVLTASEPAWILYAGVGVLAGLGLRFLVRLIRRFPRKSIYWSMAAAGILLLILFISTLQFRYYYSPPPPIFGRAKYSGYINYDKENASWVVKDDLIVLDTREVQRKIKESQYRKATGHTRPENNLPMVREDEVELAQILSSCGWQAQGSIDSMVHMIQARTIKFRARWVPLHTVSVIALPEMSCGFVSLNLDATSRAVLSIPKYMVVKTFPGASSRDELLLGENERRVVRLDVLPVETPTLQLDVASPLARNKIGSLIVKGTIWKPLNWIFLAFCGIFSEQIKKGLFVPIVERLFRALHIPFTKEESGAKKEENGESEAESPPDGI